MRLIHYDRFGKYIDDIQGVTSLKRTRNVDGTDTLAVTCLYEVSKGDRLLFCDAEQRWREYIINQPIVERADSLPVCSFSANNSIQELELKFIVDKRNDKTALSAALGKIVEGTRWQIGKLPSDVTTSANYYHVSALEALKTLCDDVACEFYTTIEVDSTQIISRTLNLGSVGGGKSSGKRFEYGTDLSMVRRTVSATPVYTRLYGYGKGLATVDENGEETGGYGRKIDFSDINDGKPYVEDTEATKIWGVPDSNGVIQPAEGIIEFPDCEDKQDLLNLTKEQLKTSASPQISYECDVEALKVAGYDLSNLHLGESVQIIDRSFTPALRLSGRVLQIEDYPLQGATDTTLTLGNIVQGYTQRNNDVAATVKQLWSSSGAVNDAAGLTPTYLDDVINGLNTVMNATGGFTYFTPGEGITVYNKPLDQNPTKAIQLGGGYLRIADSKNAAGEWEWRTFGTGSGFVADLIVAGKLMSADGLKWFDLDNGNITMQNSKKETTLYFDGTAKDNLLTGKVQTSLGEGTDKLTIDPAFTHTNFAEVMNSPTDPVSTTSTGAAIHYTPSSDYVSEPFIAVDTEDENANQISALTFYGGTRTSGGTKNEGFGAWQRMGMRRSGTSDQEGGFWQAMTQADVLHHGATERWQWYSRLGLSNYSGSGSYAELEARGTDSRFSSLSLYCGDNVRNSSFSLNAWGDNSKWSSVYGIDGQVSVTSRDVNGTVGVVSTITGGTTNLLGRVGITTNGRNTLQYYNGTSNWTGTHKVGDTLDLTVNVTPSPYGTYAPVGGADSTAWFSGQVSNTSSSSSWHVRLYTLKETTTTPWVSSLAFLK